ncbi:Hypothetical predicted protein, partial [Paramuricea clavata]
MLGDQEQLKPRVDCYKLATEKKLDCSMFERLIKNKMPFEQLEHQCRMRDDIADVLRELKIYEKGLKTNNENGYPPVDVTVLCPYRGQVDKMKSAFKLKSSDPSEEYFTKLRDINITTVDSFQA